MSFVCFSTKGIIITKAFLENNDTYNWVQKQLLQKRPILTSTEKQAYRFNGMEGNQAQCRVCHTSLAPLNTKHLSALSPKNTVIR